jgi:hypothetical protein
LSQLTIFQEEHGDEGIPRWRDGVAARIAATQIPTETWVENNIPEKRESFIGWGWEFSTFSGVILARSIIDNLCSLWCVALCVWSGGVVCVCRWIELSVANGGARYACPTAQGGDPCTATHK